MSLFFFFCGMQVSCVPFFFKGPNNFGLEKISCMKDIDISSFSEYRVKIDQDPVCLVVVPSSQEAKSQSLMVAAYQVLSKGDFDKIILVCQAESIPFHGVALPLVTDDFLFKDLDIDVSIIKKLVNYQFFAYYAVPFYGQAMQLQLDYMRLYCKDTKIVPLMLGNISSDNAYEIAVVLASCCSPQTAVVLSADFADHTDDMIGDLSVLESPLCRMYEQDNPMIHCIQAIGLNGGSAQSQSFKKSSTLILLLEFLQMSIFKKLSSYFVGYGFADNIYDNGLGDLISYAGFIFQRNQTKYKNYIGCYEQSQILQYARAGLQSLFEVSIKKIPYMNSYEMQRTHGVFASLYDMSDHGLLLRGCVGKARSTLPLYKMVYQVVKQAAYKDTRFYPLRHTELASTIISLSIVSDLKRVRDYDTISESDGVMMQFADKFAISLPALVPLPGWTWRSLLEKLSGQMGLPGFSWKKPKTKVFTFRSFVFQEE